MKVFQEVLREGIINDDEMVLEKSMEKIARYAKEFSQGSLPLKTCMGFIISESLASKRIYEKVFHPIS